MVIRKLFRKRSASRAPTFAVAHDERVYAIGDVHGRADLLEDLLEQIGDDIAKVDDDRKTRLVFLGDYVDRGDDTPRVLEILRGVHEAMPGNTTSLMGNHEAALLDFLDDPVGESAWLGFGAVQTLASYGIDAPGKAPKEADLVRTRDALASALDPHLTLLRSLSPFDRSGDVVFAHAGWRGIDDGSEASRYEMIWGFADFLTDQPVKGVKVVHGHYDDVSPVSLPGRICVDTGAYYSGVLTAVRLDEGEMFLSTGGGARG